MPLAALLLAVAPLAPVAAPQDGTLLELHTHGCEALLPAPKDAGLRAALSLVAPRLEELGGELGDPLPAVLPWAAEALTGPAHLTVRPWPEGPLPVCAQGILPQADDRSAQARLREFDALVRDMGARVVDEGRGWRRIADQPPGWYGAQGSDFVFALGARAAVPRGLPACPLPEGVEPALELAVDLDGLWALGGQGRPAPAWWSLLVGEGHMTWAAGSDGQRGYAATRLHGRARAARQRGTLAPEALTAETLRRVPADARWACVGTLRFAGLAQAISETVAELGGPPAAVLTPVLGGIEPFVGDTWGVYAADSTGGGGLLSTVAFLEVRDAERLAALLDALPEMLNAQLAASAKGYVQMRGARHGEVSLSALVFPGLPVPVEPTLAVVDGTLLVGATPQAVRGAVDQLASGRPGLAGNPRFREQLPSDLTGLRQVVFVDTPRLLPRGYGMAALACTALANATRSRADMERDAGPVLPPYAELADGARALVSVTRAVGDDLLVEARADRSWLVNFTGLCGVMSAQQGLVMTSVVASIAIPNLLQAREAANQSACLARLRQTEEALAAYAAANGRYPDRLEALAAPDAEGTVYLAELPRDPWGRPLRYEPPRRGRRFRLYSLGADGVPGGEGPAMDLMNEAPGGWGGPAGR